VKNPKIKNTNKLKAKNCLSNDFVDNSFVIIMDWHSNDNHCHNVFQ